MCSLSLFPDLLVPDLLFPDLLVPDLLFPDLLEDGGEELPLLDIFALTAS
jgi:hypothetical protein